MFKLRSFFRKLSLDELYDRQIRISGVDQGTISKAQIGIIGVGETGSHVAIYASRIGIGNIRLCDFDVVEIHNVPRMLGVTLKDVGKNKAEAVANAIRKIGNGVKAEAYNFDARDLPEEFFHGLDLAIICVDRISTRLEIGELLWSKGIPHIDVGTRELLLNIIQILPNRKDWPCMFCMRKIIPKGQLLFSNRSSSCDEKPIPTILPPGAVASAIAVNEALKIITNFKLGKPLDNFLQIDLGNLVFLLLKIPKDSNCPICGGNSNGEHIEH